MKEQDFIQKICGYAMSDMKENGVLASVTIARLFLKVPGVHLNWRRKLIITLV